jgi:hypothetical protein
MFKFLNIRTLKVMASESKASKESTIFESHNFRSYNVREIEQFSKTVALIKFSQDNHSDEIPRVSAENEHTGRKEDTNHGDKQGNIS